MSDPSWFVFEELDRMTEGLEDASAPHDIATAPMGMQILAWEPMYGWLIACLSSFDGKWRIKSSGNFWEDLPESVVFTKWMPLPPSPTEKDDA